MREGTLAVLLLAAGGSSRLGQPKQLLRIGATSLLRRAAGEALAARIGRVVVVLGARAEDIREELEELEVEICINPQWEQGMASSIAGGIRHLMAQQPSPARILLMLCDQPGVDRQVLRDLCDLHARGETEATACLTEGLPRAPAIFEGALFEDLLALEGDQGAREILRDPRRRVALLPCPEAGPDIDTRDDARSAGAQEPE